MGKRLEFYERRGAYRAVKTKKFKGDVKIKKRGKVVASGHNLAVIDRYRRNESPVKRAYADGSYLVVLFDDGAKVRTKFAGKSHVEHFISRKSSWK